MKIWSVYIDSRKVKQYSRRFLFNIVFNPFLYLLYFLSFVIPRDKNLWVCGIPKKFVWNSKYLFLHVANTKNESVKVVWISRSRTLVQELREQGCPAFYWLSFQGIYYPLRASYHIIDASIETINFWLSGGTKVVMIWHGILLKKMGQDVAKGQSFNVVLHYRAKGLQKIVFRYLLPWRFRKPDYLFVTSSVMRELSVSPFRIEREQIFITGFPKNDIYFQDIPGADIGTDKPMLKKARELKKNHSDVTTVLYAPTWRDTGGDSFFEKGSDLQQLDAFLAKQNCVFFLKLHPLAQAVTLQDIQMASYTNIHFVDPDSDVDPLLKHIDILITDYSGIYFEFLLFDRPIIFFPFDYEKYLTKDRELYFDYDEVTPGPKVTALSELIDALQYISEGHDDYAEARKSVLNMCYEKSDGGAASRAVKLLKELPH